MQSRIIQAINRLKSGLKMIAPSTIVGVFVGSMCALLLPSLISITSLLRMYAIGFPATKSGKLLEPWLKAVVAPSHLIWIAIACIIAFLYLVRQSLRLFFTRFYAWSIYEGKHISWLLHSLSNLDGEKLVNDVFPLGQLAQMAKERGADAYSTDSEKRAVAEVIQKYGSGSLPTTPS